MATSFNSRLSTAPEEGCKAPCVTVSLTNITLSGEQTIGVTAVVTGDRVLVAGQTDSAENGIWVCNSGAWTRAKDWNTAEDVAPGMLIPVSATEELYQTKPFTGAYNPSVTEITFGVGILSARSVETQTGSQAVSGLFTLTTTTYTPGANNLEVDHNGQRLNLTTDYTEPSASTVQIVTARVINPDDIFTFRTNTTVSNSVTVTTAITHTRGGVAHNLATYLDGYVMEFDTMADAIASTKVYEGAVLLVKDRASSHWDLSSSGTANGWDVIFLTASGLYATLRLDNGNTSFRALGAVGDGATSVNSLLTRVDTLLSDGATLFGHPDDDYLISGFRTFAKRLTIDLQGATISSAALSNSALLFYANTRVLNGIFDNVWLSYQGTGVDYGYVNNNRFINQTYYPIGNSDGAKNIIIDGNYFTGESDGPAGANAYPCFQATVGCEHSQFINNVCIDVNAICTYAGGDVADNCDHLLIANNRCINLQYYVVKCHEANNIVVENNYIENAVQGVFHQSLGNGGNDIAAGHQIIVRNNYFKNVEQCYRGNGYYPLRAVFSDNYCTGCDFGVYRQTGHTIVTGNQFYNGGALVYFGGDVSNGYSFSSWDLTVENNVIQDSGNLTSYTLGNDTDSTAIMGCIVVGALTDSTYLSTITIRNNTFNNYHTYGIMGVSLGSQYPRVTITDNKFDAGANSTYHMSIGASRDLILKHNKEITAPSSGVEVFFPRIDRHVGFPQYRDNDWQFATAAPTTKTWLLSSIQTHSAPATAGNIGWVNVFSFSTTLSAGEPSGETSMAVTSGTGTANGDIIGVMLDSGTVHWTTIASGGGTTTLVLTSGLTGDAASGKRVYVFRWKSYGTIA